MNCKPGDVAIVVGGRMGDVLGQALVDLMVGRIVQIAHPTEKGTWAFVEPVPLPGVRMPMGDGRWLMTGANFKCGGMHDRFLRPLPDLDENDEVLRETEKPVEVV